MSPSQGPAIWARWSPVALVVAVAFLLGWWLGRDGGAVEQDADAPTAPPSRKPELRLDPEGVTLLPDESLRWDYEGPESPDALGAGGAGGNSGMDTSEERR